MARFILIIFSISPTWTEISATVSSILERAYRQVYKHKYEQTLLSFLFHCKGIAGPAPGQWRMLSRMYYFILFFFHVLLFSPECKKRCSKLIRPNNRLTDMKHLQRLCPHEECKSCRCVNLQVDDNIFERSSNLLVREDISCDTYQ